MNDNNNNDNVFRLGAVQGGKDTDSIPEDNYVVTDIDGMEFYATGFMIFTPHHLAIMKDEGRGAIPVLVVPIGRVRAAELSEEVDDDEAEVTFTRGS